MTLVAAGILASALAYLAGSLPFGLIVARLAKGIDIRTVGSGNIGATNVARTLGTKWGALVLALDALKGLLPVWLLPRLLIEPGMAAATHVAVSCGICTVLGHMFPCWLGFRGGKGVATALGVVTVLAPWATVAAFLGFLASFVLFRFVSLSSIVASAVFAVAQFTLMWPAPFSSSNWSLAAFSLAVPLLIVVRHRGNLVRLYQGTEPRFVFRRRGTGAETPPADKK